MRKLQNAAIPTLVALALVSCATTDDVTNSSLSQPPGGAPQATESGDIAIAGQSFAHSIRDLPQVASAPVPPMVRFSGVTSIVKGPAPVDTEPYTNLLRDRLVLVCREKLRFVEQELPPLVVSSPKKKKKSKDEPASSPDQADLDYEVVAELRGNTDDEEYKIQIQFLDFHTRQVLFNGIYSIRKEASEEPSGDTAPPQVQQSSPAPAAGGGVQ